MKPKLENVPNFVTIESQILLDNNISSTEKILYSYICLLTNNKKLSCFATTKYLGGLFKISDRQIRRYLYNLKKYNYITITIVNGNKRIITTTINSFLEARQKSNEDNQEFFEFDWLNENEEK